MKWFNQEKFSDSQPLAYIKEDRFPIIFLIVDEAQTFTPHEI